MLNRLAAIALTALFLTISGGSMGAQEADIRDLFSDEYDSILYGTEKNSAAGFSLVVADVNGDSLGDLIIGSPYADARFNKKKNDAGVTYVYFGRESFANSIDLSQEADLIIHGANSRDNSGFSVGAADLNGDGLKDILIGAPLADSRLQGKKNDSGVTYVVFGRREFSARSIGLETGAADVELHSTQKGEYSGSALAAGDFNGDGIEDVLIGAPFSNEPDDDAGIVYLMCGSTSIAGEINLTSDACSFVRGLDSGDRLGMALAVGDVNADGIGDLVLGALETDSASDVSNVGRVSVIFGRNDLPAELSLRTDTAFDFWGSYDNDFVGSAVAVGDINGDGTDDILIGVPYADRNPEGAPAREGQREDEEEEEDAGKLYLFFGGESLGGQRYLVDGADVVILGTQGGANYGDHAGGTLIIADLNGDGYGDPIIGAPLADVRGRTRSDPDQMNDVGAVFVRNGGADLPGIVDLENDFNQAIYGAYTNDFFAGIALTKKRTKDALFGMLSPDSYRKAWMTKVYDRFFTKSIAAGDVDGDGIDDLFVAAPAGDGPRQAGQEIDDAGVVYAFLSRQ